MKLSEPLVAILDPPGTTRIENLFFIKLLASSLDRTAFQGDILIGLDKSESLFRIPRKSITYFNVEENHVNLPSVANRIREINKDPSRWIVFMYPNMLSLNNPNHLFEEVSWGEAETKLLYLSSSECKMARSALWAIRAGDLDHAIELFRDITERNPTIDDSDVWSKFIEQTPLRKKLIERGQVYTTSDATVDWSRARGSALLILANTQPEVGIEILQSIYFGRFIADSKGIIFNLLEP